MLGEFASLHPNVDVRLRDVWPRSALLEKANELAHDDADVRHLIDNNTDEWDEGLILTDVTLYL